MPIDPLSISAVAVFVSALSAWVNWRRDDRKERREESADFDRRLSRAERELDECTRDKQTIQRMLDQAQRENRDILRRLYSLEHGQDKP